MQVKRGKTEYTPGSGSVDVKRGKSEKHRPFFFVRLRIDGQELCGPRHVTEEAAKRDKESLMECLAGVARDPPRSVAAADAVS